MPKFRLEQNSEIRGNEQAISVSVVPPPPLGCRVNRIFVNDVPIDDVGQKVGSVTVTNIAAGPGYFALKAPKNHAPIKVDVTLVCGNSAEVITRQVGLNIKDQENPVDATSGFLDGIIDVFKKIADFLGDGFKRLLPEDLRDALKKIKGVVGKGIDIVSNLLPGIPIPVPGLPLIPLGNLEHLKKKIGEHLKDLDPLDHSSEAVLADAEALRLLILEDVIPFVQQVGTIATNDLQQYTNRLSVMRKMGERLGNQLEMLAGPKRVRKGRKKAKARR
jgi:hypothetical protein